MKHTKSKYRLGAIAAAALGLVLLTGCTGIGDSAQEAVGEAASALESSAKEAVGEAAAALESSVEKAVDVEALKNGETLELSTSAQAVSGKELRVDNAVGNVEVKKAEGSEITVKAVIRAQAMPFSKEDLQSVFDQATVSIDQSGNELRVYTHAKEDADRSLWAWAKSKLNYTNFAIDYIISLPASVNSFDIQNDVGDIVLGGLEGSYKVATDVGEIQIKDAGVTGGSEISTSTGSIELGIARMENEGDLRVRADIGSIEVDLAESVQCELETKVDVGDIEGAPKGKSTRGDGGPLLALEAAVGSVTVK